MSEYNPYTPPVSDVSITDNIDSNPLDLAERGTRLGASILDGLILIALVIPAIWFLYATFGHKFWEPVPGSVGIWLTIGAVAIGAVFDLAVNGFLLYKNGQTVGKKICSIKIVKENGEIPSLFDSFFKRRLLFTLFQQVPILGNILPLVDALMIFRASRRCLHDQVAGTIVIKA